MYKYHGKAKQLRTAVTASDASNPSIDLAEDCSDGNGAIAVETSITGSGVSFDLTVLTGSLDKTSWSEAQTISVSQADGAVQKFILDPVPLLQQVQVRIDNVVGTTPSIDVQAFSLAVR